MENFGQLFRDFESIKVGVIGDVMLDTYIWGEVERISPEAPVPVVSLHHKEQRLGGAGNVALNLQSMGAEAFVLSVTGADDDARCLMNLYADHGINTAYCFGSEDRVTTNKTRIISRNQQMMRLDAEITRDLSPLDQKTLLEKFRQFADDVKPQVVVLEDYNKGVLTEEVIAGVIAICKQAGILTAVDPKRKNFFSYKGVDIFKPNLKEVREALNMLSVDVELHHLEQIHRELQAILQHRISLITLSEKGVFFQKDEEAAIIPSHIRNIADVSGAGDTVIAVAALVYAARKNVHLMAELANIAGGLVCEEVGTAAINPQKLFHECEMLLS
ncbi:bifunctional heptose 7-phosphate kinase/heptose 1-phosphate adenyltransferase [Flavisolibacter nicotianae]|uniref:bifunctional heptose 7-phosphate kinase/heptose 1-phosphate adenyltransferase n=1 Tax=Flavisolibacter nicotianae TaxID=2364882 RepID=UPI000EAFA4FE|nr:bifunctional ADP-heptose synthase [Flavisolibacter nicotianae]